MEERLPTTVRGLRGSDEVDADVLMVACPLAASEFMRRGGGESGLERPRFIVVVRTIGDMIGFCCGIGDIAEFEEEPDVSDWEGVGMNK